MFLSLQTDWLSHLWSRVMSCSSVIWSPLLSFPSAQMDLHWSALRDNVTFTSLCPSDSSLWGRWFTTWWCCTEQSPYSVCVNKSLCVCVCFCSAAVWDDGRVSRVIIIMSWSHTMEQHEKPPKESCLLMKFWLSLLTLTSMIERVNWTQLTFVVGKSIKHRNSDAQIDWSVGQ